MSTRVKVKIEGRTPLLMNKHHGEKDDPEATAREIAEKKIHRSPVTNKIIIPQAMIFKAIIEAGQFHKTGIRQYTTRDRSIIPGALEMDKVEYPLVYKEPWSVDIQSGVNPKTKGRVLIHRARFDEWALEFELNLFDPKTLPQKDLRLIVDDAGMKCGLGDFRPNRKGSFGKFGVILWKAIPTPKCKAA